MGHFTHMLEHDATRGDIWIVKARQLSCCVQHQLSQFTQAWLRRRNFAEVPSAAECGFYVSITKLLLKI